MSSESCILTEIMDFIALKQTLTQLEAQLEESKQIATEQGTVSVDVVVRDPSGTRIGFKKNAQGKYEVLTEAGPLSAQQRKVQVDFVKKIRQKYAYNKVIAELKKQGYSIAEETTVQNNTIRLVARKWS